MHDEATDFPHREAPTIQLPSAEIDTGKGFSIIWLIPIIALLIGAWLAYKTLSEKGPTISVSFKDGRGLTAGKTKVKYKAVVIGEVTEVELSDDLSHVETTISMDKDAGSYLTEHLKLWVVRPRIGLSGITGLGTLVSGAYIDIEPSKGKPARQFKGLDQGPLVRSDTPGQKYVLRTQNLGSIQRGSPVYYRSIHVGEVLGHKLERDNSILIHIFINTPHHRFVRKNSRFWNTSGIDLSMNADGVKLKTESLEALLLGGMAFDAPTVNGKIAPPAKINTLFSLYQDQASINKPAYTERVRYVMYFDDSVRGLKVGAPVDFRGIQIGEVTDVKLEFEGKTGELRIPVMVDIEPQRVTDFGGKNTDPKAAIQALVKTGLRGQLQTGSLLTGQLYVGLDFHPDTPIQPLATQSRYPQLPTIPTSLDAITEGAQALVAKLHKLPLDKIANETLQTIRGARMLLNSQELQKTPGSINQTLASARNALSMLDEDAPARIDLVNSLEEIATAARSIRVLTDYLEQHPDALVYGKGGPRR